MSIKYQRYYLKVEINLRENTASARTLGLTFETDNFTGDVSRAATAVIALGNNEALMNMCRNLAPYAIAGWFVAVALKESYNYIFPTDIQRGCIVIEFLIGEENAEKFRQLVNSGKVEERLNEACRSSPDYLSGEGFEFLEDLAVTHLNLSEIPVDDSRTMVPIKDSKNELLPQNVKVKKNSKKPHRCVDVSFNRPISSKHVECYRISALSESGGRTKFMTVKGDQNKFTFQYLRSDDEYHLEIEVWFHEGGFSETLRTIKFKTDKAPGGAVRQKINVMNMRGAQDSTFVAPKVLNVNISNEGNQEPVNIMDDKDFGKVRDLKFEEEPDVGAGYGCISWDAPVLHADDYKIEHFEVCIRKGQQSFMEVKVMVSDSKQPRFKTAPFLIMQQQSYEISVKTMLDDVENDVLRLSHPESVRIERAIEESMTNIISSFRGMIVVPSVYARDQRILQSYLQDSLSRTNKREYTRMIEADGMGSVTQEIQSRGNPIETTPGINTGNTRTLPQGMPTHWSMEEKFFAAGSYGEIYLATDHDTNNILAVKVQKNLPDSKDQKSIERELHMVKILRHERVVKFYGFQYSSNNKETYIFMEFMSGGSLLDKVKKAKGLKKNQTRIYTKQVLEGLKYIHSKKVVHKDIRCANLLLDEKDNIKIGDFGLSKSILSMESRRSKGFGAAGSWPWMCPEALDEDPEHSKFDIWNLGCTVYEMLTTEPPWMDCKGASKLLRKITSYSYQTLPKNLPEGSTSQMETFLWKIFRPLGERADAETLLQDEWIQRPN